MREGPLVIVDNVSKKYSVSIKHGIKYGLSDIYKDLMGKSTDNSGLRDGEFWAVKDVSFKLCRGEAFGLVGGNGAGKSTLVKMLNGIFNPDRGSITVRGKVVAIIEVGAGFHPLLTGRENIYVSAAVLGMSRNEVDEKFDDIVAFSDLKDFIDMPVKNYSSGMYVRLGFAVAIHSNPDVLILDEVLAVGDMAFRSKCYDAIDKLRDKCALIFVSHVMQEVGRVCSTGALMKDGKIVFIGSSEVLVSEYNRQMTATRKVVCEAYGDDKAELVSVNYYCGLNEISELLYGGDTYIRVGLNVKESLNNVILNMTFESVEDRPVFQCASHVDQLLNLDVGNQSWGVEIANLPLVPGSYYISILIQSSDLMVPYVWVKKYSKVTVVGSTAGGAPVRMQVNWCEA